MVRGLLSAFSLAAVIAGGAVAQTPFSQNFTFISGGSGFDSYSAKFNGTPSTTIGGEPANTAFQIWCVDPMQYVSGGDNYTAWVTPFAAGTTSFGITGHTLAIVPQSANGYGISHTAAASGTVALADYVEAAYIASHMNPGNQDSYECAIWMAMGYTGSGWPMSGCNATTSNSIIAGIDLSSVNLADWGVISDGTTKQEFIYQYQSVGTPQSVVPEPATLSLFATGLVGLGGAALRRRKRKQ